MAARRNIISTRDRVMELWPQRDTVEIARKIGITEAEVYNEIGRAKGVTEKPRTKKKRVIRRRINDFPPSGTLADRIIQTTRQQPSLDEGAVARIVDSTPEYVRSVWRRYGFRERVSVQTPQYLDALEALYLAITEEGYDTDAALKNAEIVLYGSPLDDWQDVTRAKTSNTTDEVA